MRGCSSAAAAAASTSFTNLLSSSSATGRAPNLLCSASETQTGGLRFIGCGGGDFASSRRNLSPLACVQRNAILSVASSSIQSSKSQIELEPMTEGRLHLSDEDNLRTVCIKIQLQKECRFGEQFFVVGAQPELGLWNPLDAVPMTWSDGHLWTAELDIPLGEPVQFKFILREISGEFSWQPGQDRVLHTWETSNIISVFEDWEDAEAQQVTEERAIRDYEESDVLETKTKQLKHSDEKYNNEETYETSECAHSAACSNHETVATVADDISHHANTDMDRVRSEGQISSVQDDSFPRQKPPFDIIADRITPQTETTAEISGNQVVDEDVTSHTSEDVLEEKEGPTLVPGLNPCSTTPNEDVTVKEEQVKVEPDNSNIASYIKAEKPEEQVNGQAELEEVNGRLTLNDEHAPTDDEDVNSHPDQYLESAFSECQSNKDSDPWRDDIKWPGQKTLKRLLNNLGFL